MPIAEVMEEAFLDAARADPYDDLPLLALADYLEEQGEQGRAELVRQGSGYCQRQSGLRSEVLPVVR